ncbi:DUF885 domain-containing protein [Sphingomonas nostoxanthinifaciens]|uniref:DUF885 domain-containing protein n=1 Tax=Sphingomonas nostoxanthinifaciens TaxID=2872652 RepID=UPI001CC1C730|nr:DUF885 family protein [Sphingomonas nostoxanthinifaciens]UAK23071.1 DUF885 family protein [Sphingomonas nostoxanthinifaciens]
MDRRSFLASSAAASVAIGMPTRLFAQSGDAQLNALFDAIFQDNVANSPELASSLGLDKGANAAAKHRLSDRSAADTARNAARVHGWLAKLRQVDRATLSPASQLNLDVILYSQQARVVSYDRFKIGSVIRPYRIFQQGGAYFEVPDFLNSTHSIATTEDCEAYLDRLAAFAGSLDQDSAVQKAEAARGFLAPGFCLDLTLGQMAKLRGAAAADSNMVRSLATRAAAKGISGDWSGRATKIVEGQVYPALDRQIALMKQLRTTATDVAGVWRLPQGDAIYAAALEQATTTKLTPAEVHKMGLDQVASIGAQLDVILRQQGLTQGSVGARLTALNTRADQLYADSAAGRAELLASLNARVADMYTRLPNAFAEIPTAKLEIRAVPVEIQDGASNGYYQRGALDGSRPAIYFINLKDVGDWPKYSLPSLSYHEGVPGHHLQISTAQESKNIPTLRKTGGFSAYTEGWALYAEQLADELHAYQSPVEKAGYLQSFLFRAARLVVDTGIHEQKWTAEQATDYLVATTGFARPRSRREVERYCTQAGQACSYKVGHMAWTAARARTQKALGDRFDVKQFHEILKDGVMPLTILDARVDARIAAAQKG